MRNKLWKADEIDHDFYRPSVSIWHSGLLFWGRTGTDNLDDAGVKERGIDGKYPIGRESSGERG